MGKRWRVGRGRGSRGRGEVECGSQSHLYWLTTEMRQCRSPHCCQLRKWSKGSSTALPTHLLLPVQPTATGEIEYMCVCVFI